MACLRKYEHIDKWLGWNTEEKPKEKLEIKPYIIDITSLAVKKQHKQRYPKINGKFIKIDIIVLKKLNENKGFFCFVSKKDLNRKTVHKFLEKIGINPSEIIHDKDFLFNFGVSFNYSPTVKQAIEHIFGFKRVIYQKWRNKEITTIKQLIETYRYYFTRIGLKEISIY